jgi:sec-independent protein translocase protein TatA
MGPTYGLLAFLSMPGGGEMIILGIIGLLIFGNRLPEVAKSLGKSVVEFKKGLSGVQDEIERSVNASHQADILPPPSPAPVTSASSVESSTSTVESSATSTVESPSSPAVSSIPEATAAATPTAEAVSQEPAHTVSRTLGPNGEWVEAPS